MACVGHWVSQARHFMQSFSLAGSDFFSEFGWPGESPQSNRVTGQTSTQIPSPVQMSQSTATSVPWMPSFFGGSTGPQTLCPLCWSATFRVFWKSGSIGKLIHPSYNESLRVLTLPFLGCEQIRANLWKDAQGARRFSLGSAGPAINVNDF